MAYSKVNHCYYNWILRLHFFLIVSLFTVFIATIAIGTKYFREEKFLKYHILPSQLIRVAWFIFSFFLLLLVPWQIIAPNSRSKEDRCCERKLLEYISNISWLLLLNSPVILCEKYISYKCESLEFTHTKFQGYFL